MSVNLFFPTLKPDLRGGGLDCSKLSEDNFSLQDLEDYTGDWQRVGAYADWVEARIFEETQPGRKVSSLAENKLCFCPAI